MASISEVGHARNVANFQDLLAFINGYGSTYNPSKASLAVAQLTLYYTNATNSLQNVINFNTEYNNKVNDRVEAFDGLRKLSTRLINAIQTTEATPEKINDAKGYNRKIQGKRASNVTYTINPNRPAPFTISSSQQSYDQLIQHFNGLIAVLESEPSYAPNETDLAILALHARADQLALTNANVSLAHTAVSNARISRNRILYLDNLGLVAIAAAVKKYVISVFGAKSPEFGQIKGIYFTKLKL